MINLKVCDKACKFPGKCHADVFERMNLGAIAKFEEYMDKVLREDE